MYSLEEHKNRNPIPSGRSKAEYNRAMYREWREHCLRDARRYWQEGEVDSAVIQLIQILEEEYENE